MPLALPPFAASALHWTMEHGGPWAVAKGTGMFGRWRENRERTKKEALAFQMAEALIPEQAMCVLATCAPQSSEGIVREQLVFGLRMICMSSVGIRPVSLEGLSATLLWNGQVGSVVLMPERALSVSREFLLVGDEHPETFSCVISWQNDSPPTGAAVSLAISGTLTLHAPWRAEYKKARFSSKVYVRVIEGIPKQASV